MTKFPGAAGLLETASDSLPTGNALVPHPIAALRWDFNAVTTPGIHVECKS